MLALAAGEAKMCPYARMVFPSQILLWTHFGFETETVWESNITIGWE